MKKLINFYFESDPIIEDMTDQELTFVSMAIACGLVADPDYTYKLEGFSESEILEIEKEVARLMGKALNS